MAGDMLSFWSSHGTEAGICPGIKLGASKAVDSDAVWVQRPMTYKQFSRLLQGMLMACGHSSVSAAQFTYNSLRRTLPTAGDICRVDDADAQAIGNWEDIPATAAKRETKASEPMCRRYSGGKVAFTGTIKGRVLAATIEYAKNFLRERKIAPNQHGLFPVNCVTWEDLREMHIPSAAVENLWDSPGWETGGSCAHTQAEQDVAATPPPAIPGSPSTEAKPATSKPVEESDSSSSSSSESASDGSDSTLADAVAADEAPVAWFVQGKETVNIVCMRPPANGWPVPKCKEECERTFRLAPTLEGSGPLPVGLTICGSCRRRMPSAALAD